MEISMDVANKVIQASIKHGDTVNLCNIDYNYSDFEEKKL